MTRKRVLIFGFSNVATTNGFSVPLIEKMAQSNPEVEVFRIGLGALQPHIVPPYLRLAASQLGPFSDVLLEINTSAFSLHPFATPALGRELLLDTLHTIVEFGAQPAFLLLYRDMLSKEVFDFNELTHNFCRELDLPILDLAGGLVAEKGRDFVHGLLRDTTHTTEEGSEYVAERAHAFLANILERERKPDLAFAPLPQWRRRSIDLPALLADQPKTEIESANLFLSHAVFSETDNVTVEFLQPVHALGLSFLYHTAGGHADVTVNDAAKPQRLTSIDHVSYFDRIGVMPFDFFRGATVDRLQIGPMQDAAEVTLLKDEKTKPLVNFIGPLLTMHSAS